jgi:N-acetylated-alpha-linked acidic dipeptidase
MLYAPGRFTGYDPKTIPAVRESIELEQWPVAIDYIAVVSQVLDTASGRLDEAATQLTPRLGSGLASRPGQKVTPVPPPDGL